MPYRRRVISPAGLVFSLLLPLVVAGVLLAALYFVISAAVEQGIRRSLPDSSLRPSAQELRRQQQQRDRDW